MRQLICLTIALLLVACSEPSNRSADAGASKGTGPRGAIVFHDTNLRGCITVNGQQVCGDGGTLNGVVPSNGGPLQPLLSHLHPKPAEIKPPDTAKPKVTPPDPRVSACMRQAKDGKWVTLKACFDEITKPPQSDAGVKMAAIRPPILCPAMQVPDWYFSPSGLDDNTCVDQAHPCFNPNEVKSRLACGADRAFHPEFTSGSTWHVHGDMPESSAFALEPIISENNVTTASFAIACDTTTIATGLSLGTVTSKNHGTDQALNVNLGANAASYVGFQIVNTTRSNSIAWVDSIVSGNVALLSQPINPASGAEVDTWTAGDSFQILRPGQLWLKELTGICTTHQCEAIYPLYGNQPNIVNCWLPATGVGAQVSKLTRVRADTSRFDTLIDVTKSNLHNSLVTTAPYAWRSSAIRAGSITNLNTLSPLIGGIPIVGGSDNEGDWFLDDVIVHGSMNISVGTALSVNDAYCDNLDGETTATWNVLGTVFPTTVGEPALYGHCVIEPEWGGLYTFESNSSSVFGGGGITLQLQGQTSALTPNFALNPVEFYELPLTVSALFTAFPSGFGGIALSNNVATGFYNWLSTGLPANPGNLVWGPINGGTGLDAGCPAGSLLEGDDAGTYRCSQICGPNDVVVTDPTGTMHVCSQPSPPGDAAAVLTWQPTATISLTGEKLLLEEDLGIHLSGSTVTQWDDQSGNGLNVTPGSSPTFNTGGGPNGTGRVTFATGNNYLTNSNNVVTAGHDRTMWLVLRNQAGAANGGTAFTFAISDNSLQFDWAAPTGRILTDSLTFTDTTTYSDDSNYHLAEWDYHSGSQVLFYVDGTSQSVSGGAAGSETGSAGFFVGAGRGHSAGLIGDLIFVLVIDHLASSGERVAVGNYVATKWGLTIAGSSPSGWTPETIGAAHSVVVAEGAPAFGFVAPGTSGTCLCSNGASSDPSYQTIVSGVSSVSAGSGLTCSPTTGAVVCSDNCSTCLPDPVTVAHGGTGDTTLSAHGYLLGQGTSAVTVLGACGLENIPYGQGTTTDPICSTFKFSGPGPSGNILKSDGTDWQSVAFGTPTTISSSVNHGGPTSLTNAYQTIATLTITVSGTTVDCHAGAEWDITTSASSPQQINWGISQDSSTTPTNVHSLDAATGAAMTFSLGAADEELYNPSASSHTYRVLAEFATAQTNVTSNAFRADLLCLQH